MLAANCLAVGRPSASRGSVIVIPERNTPSVDFLTAVAAPSGVF